MKREEQESTGNKKTRSRSSGCSSKHEKSARMEVSSDDDENERGQLTTVTNKEEKIKEATMKRAEYARDIAKK